MLLFSIFLFFVFFFFFGVKLKKRVNLRSKIKVPLLSCVFSHQPNRRKNSKPKIKEITSERDTTKILRRFRRCKPCEERSPKPRLAWAWTGYRTRRSTSSPACVAAWPPPLVLRRSPSLLRRSPSLPPHSPFLFPFDFFLFLTTLQATLVLDCNFVDWAELKNESKRSDQPGPITKFFVICLWDMVKY